MLYPTSYLKSKDLEKRARILQAAKAIFLKSGYHGTSMNLIAQEAGVTKLTVY
ncbi:TetR family transcriptional regulator, partial [Acinetobacter baumannii]|nr:TetR family transcriptional regulator [Acinetobacter baumannii]